MSKFGEPEQIQVKNKICRGDTAEFPEDIAISDDEPVKHTDIHLNTSQNRIEETKEVVVPGEFKLDKVSKIVTDVGDKILQGLGASSS